MKIMYCVTDLSFSGGTERVICSKVNYLAEILGYDVSVVVTDNQRHVPHFFISDKVQRYNLEINYNTIYAYPFLTQLLIQIQKRKLHKKLLSEIISVQNPDIVVSTYGHEFSFLPKIKQKSKIVGEIHFAKNVVSIENKSKRKGLLSKWFAKLADSRKHLFISQYDRFVVLTKRDLENWPNKKNLVQIYNPLAKELETASEINYETKNVISVGRLTYQKGFDLLIEAWDKGGLSEKGWRLNIFGEGNEEKFLKKKIEELGLQDQILIHPPVKNIMHEYLNSSIYVLPSRYEGFGLVLIEAMECGLPCVAFDCPEGPSEIISEGEDGFLVEAGNVDLFAKKLKTLMQDEKLRSQFGTKAKQNVKRFSIDVIMNQWNELFKELLSENQKNESSVIK